MFYFGNAVGETGDSAADAFVTSNDASRVAANFTNSAAVTNVYDVNRDGIVNSADVDIVNSNQTGPSDALKLITVPPAGAAPITPPPALSIEDAQWNSASGGSWNTDGNWTDASEAIVAAPGVRGVAGDTIDFSSPIASAARLDGANPSVAAIVFNSSASGFTIAEGSGGILHLAAGASSATITVASGDQTIGAPVQLDSSLIVAPVAGTRLTISGGITGAGGLTVNDAGAVVLSGTNAYAGGSAVLSGTLIVTSPSSLPANANLTIGADTAQFFVPAAPASAGAFAIAGAAIVNNAQAVSIPVSLPTSTAEIVHARAAAVSLPRFAVNPAWLAQPGGASDNLDRHDAALAAWDAVIAQYGQ